MSFEKYKEALLQGGATEEEADLAIAEAKRKAACADRLECYLCAGKLTKKVDGRQEGVSELPGIWFNYRCTKCGDFFDRKEAIEKANLAPVRHALRSTIGISICVVISSSLNRPPFGNGSGMSPFSG